MSAVYIKLYQAITVTVGFFFFFGGGLGLFVFVITSFPLDQTNVTAQPSLSGKLHTVVSSSCVVMGRGEQLGKERGRI